MFVSRLGIIVGVCVAAASLNVTHRLRADEQPKPASDATRAVHSQVIKDLPFADRRDFEDAARGLIAPLPDGGVLRNDRDAVIWDPRQFDFIKLDKAAPETVNPSLWRQAQLLTLTGLFKVTDQIYQVRGYDLANITFIEGREGIVVVDPLMAVETARASLELYYKHRPKKPIVAVIYTHSHSDHFSGAAGVISQTDVETGKVRVIAPEHFLDEVVSENVMAGIAMSRRGGYMFGSSLPRGPQGQVTAALGLALPGGTRSLILPTQSIRKTGDKLVIDGLTYEFQMAPDTEAPSEFHFFIPELKALCTAENAIHTMHNVYTLRGAKMRDARAWAYFLGEALELFGARSDVLFAPHHWPVWGKDRVNEHISTVRDTFKYIHDQTLRLANHGYTMVEIAEMIELPESLRHNWASRGYYGSLNHNAKAVYNFYLGWFDGNPATLHELPPADAARRYVDYMGGAEAVLAKARRDFEAGEYRWVAEVVSRVVFADPQNKPARALLADAFEQLGYQSENATWRNFYLRGAAELRNGVQKIAGFKGDRPEILRAMPLDQFFDCLAVRLNGPKAAGKKRAINVIVSDTNERFVLILENSVLRYRRNRESAGSDCAVTLTRAGLNELFTGRSTPAEKIRSGLFQIAGKPEALEDVLSCLDDFDYWFELVAPNPPPKP
jgi:alkyl sulfatase BDS1-like metallo-beta-lactamase superfamily hydrolase